MIIKALSVLAVIPLVAGCMTPPPPPENPLAACPETRPMVCTTIYAPVCASHSDGHQETHASSCNACADETVTGYVDGVCEEAVE